MHIFIFYCRKEQHIPAIENERVLQNIAKHKLIDRFSIKCNKLKRSAYLCNKKKRRGTYRQVMEQIENIMGIRTTHIYDAYTSKKNKRQQKIKADSN